jgi:nucleotide sugar dehydrogenase
MLERIAIIGIGRIGLCLALSLERAGFPVLGIDKDRGRVKLIQERALVTSEPGVEEAIHAAGELRVADSIAEVREFNPKLVFIAVDTPTVAEGGYDHSRVDQVVAEMLSLEWPHDRVELALVCTTLPGYCDSKADLAKSHGFALSYTPGFVAQGSILRDQRYPDQIVIGEADAIAGETLARVLRAMCSNDPPVHRMSRMGAEIAKLALNCALTMKIAFANAIGDLATSVGAEPEAILAAIGADSRIGDKFLKYGFGFGGPCFPRDNRALNFFARQNNYEVSQASVTDEMNRRHLAFQVNEFLRAHGESEPVHFSYVTYKPGTEMLDESQPLALAVQLAQAGRRVVIHESPTIVAQLRARFGDLLEYCDATS